MEMPQLNFDVISEILRLRMEAKKEDRMIRETRKKFSDVVKVLDEINDFVLNECEEDDLETRIEFTFELVNDVDYYF